MRKILAIILTLAAITAATAASADVPDNRIICGRSSLQWIDERLDLPDNAYTTDSRAQANYMHERWRVANKLPLPKDRPRVTYQRTSLGLPWICWGWNAPDLDLDYTVEPTPPKSHHRTVRTHFLEDLMRCKHDYKPAAVIRKLQEQGVIGRKPISYHDGIPTYRITKRVRTFGLEAKLIEAWDHKGSMFKRGPGTSPPVFVAVGFDRAYGKELDELLPAGLLFPPKNIYTSDMTDMSEPSPHDTYPALICYLDRWTDEQPKNQPISCPPCDPRELDRVVAPKDPKPEISVIVPKPVKTTAEPRRP